MRIVLFFYLANDVVGRIKDAEEHVESYAHTDFKRKMKNITS